MLLLSFNMMESSEGSVVFNGSQVNIQVVYSCLFSFKLNYQCAM